LGGLGVFFGGAKLTKAPPWRRDCTGVSFEFYTRYFSITVRGHNEDVTVGMPPSHPLIFPFDPLK